MANQDYSRLLDDEFLNAGERVRVRVVTRGAAEILGAAPSWVRGPSYTTVLACGLAVAMLGAMLTLLVCLGSPGIIITHGQPQHGQGRAQGAQGPWKESLASAGGLYHGAPQPSAPRGTPRDSPRDTARHTPRTTGQRNQTASLQATISRLQPALPALLARAKKLNLTSEDVSVSFSSKTAKGRGLLQGLGLDQGNHLGHKNDQEHDHDPDHSHELDDDQSHENEDHSHEQDGEHAHSGHESRYNLNHHLAMSGGFFGQDDGQENGHTHGLHKHVHRGDHIVPAGRCYCR